MTTAMKKCPHCKGSGEIPERYITGRNMRRRRERMGVGLREFARTIGFAPSYLCHLEAGRREWSLDMVDAYNDGLAKFE